MMLLLRLHAIHARLEQSGPDHGAMVGSVSRRQLNSRKLILLAISAFSYTLHHVATTGRTHYPWSERRMGVYHSFDLSKSVWIILQPTPAALKLLEAALDASRLREPHFPHDPTMLHALLFQSTLPGWTVYLKYLEALVRSNVRGYN